MIRSLSLLSCILTCAAAERINHAGRVLPDTPAITAPILFHSAEADAVMASLQLMPRDNPWNEEVAALPLLANSAAITTKIRDELAADRRGLRIFFEMNYVIVPAGQATQDMRLLDYPDESDAIAPGTTDIARFPFPATLPVETWPRETGALSLDAWQQDGNGGDRHSITFQVATGLFWETWQTRKVTTATPIWQASNCAQWDIASNALRPAGWTSADAAGLPMLPALIRYDEIERGEIEHALRLIVKHTRRAYLYPATHHASVPSTTDPDVPAMGERLRLKASFVVPAGWSRESKIVAAALKRYGALVADNGNFLSISACPDPRFAAGCFDDLRAITPTDFEVVQGTGANEGPRSAGLPNVNAGPDLFGTVSGGATLSATTSAGPATVTWSLASYPSPPGTASFTTPNALSTAVDVSTEGDYTFVVRVDDGVHGPVYDAVRVNFTSGTPAAPAIAAGQIHLSGTVSADTVSVAVDGVPATLSGTTFHATVADDAGTVEIQAVDAHGNVSTRQITVANPVQGSG